MASPWILDTTAIATQDEVGLLMMKELFAEDVEKGMQKSGIRSCVEMLTAARADNVKHFLRFLTDDVAKGSRLQEVGQDSRTHAALRLGGSGGDGCCQQSEDDDGVFASSRGVSPSASGDRGVDQDSVSEVL